jgi:hypothetical protein
METEQIIEQLRPWLNRHKRMAWLPDVEHGDGLIAVSKFAGKPWLAAGMAWLACGHCQAPLALFLQLNLDQLPAALKHHFGDLQLGRRNSAA